MISGSSAKEKKEQRAKGQNNDVPILVFLMFLSALWHRLSPPCPIRLPSLPMLFFDSFGSWMESTHWFSNFLRSLMCLNSYCSRVNYWPGGQWGIEANPHWRWPVRCWLRGSHNVAEAFRWARVLSALLPWKNWNSEFPSSAATLDNCLLYIELADWSTTHLFPTRSRVREIFPPLSALHRTASANLLISDCRALSRLPSWQANWLSFIGWSISSWRQLSHL